MPVTSISRHVLLHIVISALAGYAAYRLALHRLHAGEMFSFWLGVDVLLAGSLFLNRLRHDPPVIALMKAAGLFALFALLVALGWALYHIAMFLLANSVPTAAWIGVVAALWGAWRWQRKLPTAHAWLWALTAVSAALHATIALAIGARFWWDSIVYVELAEHIFNFATLKTLYAGQYGLLFQHIMPGLPVEIDAFEALFGRYMWIAITVFQNGLNAFACAYLATSFAGRLSRPAQLLVVILTALLPYYAAYHNAILTESVSASVVLFIVGATLRCLDNHLSLARAVVIVLVLGFVGGQFRSYLAGVGVGCAMFLIFDKARFSRPLLYFATIAMFAAALLAFPLYRVAAGANFVLPNNNPWLLQYIADMNWDLDAHSQHALNGVVFDPAVRHKLIATHESLTIYDTIKIADDLSERGYDRGEIGRLVARASWVIRLQSWQTVRRQLQLSLQSVGFQWLAICCDGALEVSRGTTNADTLKQIEYYWKWQAGLDDGDYATQFSGMTKEYRTHPAMLDRGAIDRFASRVGPYVPSEANTWRDPLRLGRVPADILLVLGLIGLGLLARQDWRIWVILAFLELPIYAAVLFTAALGNNRYAHLLWPVYFIGIAALMDTIWRRCLDRTGGLIQN